ncbi:Homeodomain-like protein, partial [Lentinula novae-zelandiae]
WQALASEVPGRDNKACRKRWLHCLSPTVKKLPWTAGEDYLLLSLLSGHGPKWSFIARQIEGRTDDACLKRYSEALDPTLKKDEWTSDEEAKLLQVYSVIGGKWKETS